MQVYTGYHSTSEIEHRLCACTVDNPLAKSSSGIISPYRRTNHALSHLDLLASILISYIVILLAFMDNFYTVPGRCFSVENMKINLFIFYGHYNDLFLVVLTSRFVTVDSIFAGICRMLLPYFRVNQLIVYSIVLIIYPAL